MQNFINQLPEEFHVEGNPISGDWSIIDISDIESLPKIQGIYFVISDNDEILYIGRSTNIHERWRTGHHKTVKFFKYVSPNIMYICLPDASIKQISFLESYYIRKHSPLEQW